MIDLLKCSFSRNSKFGHFKIVVVGLLANCYYRKRDLLYFEELIIRRLSLALQNQNGHSKWRETGCTNNANTN